ncbi:hypothetical protein MNV49_005075 [Pseudohyphozyma bogoriensis]|nr:hypothetical protein MNV49_005075 [Pseudohyphozyma bogoriensis]
MRADAALAFEPMVTSPSPPADYSFSDSDTASISPRSSSSVSESPFSSLASSPALPPTSRGSPILDDLCLPDSLDLPSRQPTKTQLSSYAAQIIRNEAYALLALAARLAPAAEPIQDDADEPFAAEYDDHHRSESKTNVAFRGVIEALAGLPPHGKIIVTGVGKSGIVARKMVATFNSLGITATFLHPLEALHGDLGVVCPCSPSNPCDALFMISHSGATAELMRLLPIVRPRVRFLAAITRDPDSVLARGCGMWLDAGTGAYCGPVKDGEKVTDEADTALPAPTSSVMTALAIGDAVALSLSRIRLGWEKDGKARRADFLRCHPGGQLGIALGREGRGVTEGLAPATA